MSNTDISQLSLSELIGSSDYDEEPKIQTEKEEDNNLTLIEGNTKEENVEELKTQNESAETTSPDANKDRIESINVYEYIMKNKDKLSGVKQINLALSNIPKDKYLLYVTTAERNANLYKIDFPNTLQFKNVQSPTSIKVLSSGVIVVCKNQRNYVLKTNCIQFELDEEGVPIEMSTVSKISKKNPVSVTKPANKYKEVESFKLIIKKEAQTLYNKIKEFQTIDAIIKEVKAFRDTRKDILYQIKLDKVLMDLER